MKLINLLITLIFTSFLVLKQAFADQNGHICSHDPSILQKIMPQEYYDSIQEMSQKRKMVGGSPQPYRVTTDYSYLDDPTNGTGMDSTKKDYIIKIMKAAQMFLKNFIKVIPRSTPIKKRGGALCYDINVPSSLLSTGISNSDLHILVTFENKPASSTLANAVACDYDPGPIVGRIKFNIGTMKNIGTTAQAFESDFSTALHEITHILGFSSSAMQYWIDSDTNQPYLSNVGKIQVKDTVRGVSNVIKLKSKNVVETARRYYNCPTLDSVPMENQGGSGSFGSHWERDLIQNEYMTASAILGHSVISEFTAALLMDTGFYAEINTNLIEKTYWGRGKGCDFINKSCDDTNNQYPEFTYNSKTKCDFYSVGYGVVQGDPFSQCQVIQNYSNAQCFDDVQNSPHNIKRNNSGPGSKCFFSTSLDKTYTIADDNGVRCHKYTCSADNSQIIVNLWKDASLEIKATCTKQNQVIDLTKISSNTKGSLTCPADFNLFCNFPLSCSNFCNGNGICSNAQCYCLEGFVSEDCSKQCPPPQVWDGTKCVVNCENSTYLNPDNSCKATCPKAYFKNNSSNTCDLCYRTCSVCTDPLNTSCSECNPPYILKGTTCQDPNVVTCDSSCLTCSGSNINQCLTCSDGRFLDQYKQCTLCQSPCKNCTDSTIKCIDCIADHTFNSANNTCYPICDISCLTCSSPKDDSKCLTCNDGYFLASGKCLQCSSPCKTCLTTSTKCLSCITNYTYDSSNNVCNPDCDASCKNCSQPKDPNSCISCYDGSFLDVKCNLCTTPCKTCENSSTKCSSCITNYNFDSSKNQCNPVCDTTCKTCSKPNDANSCLSCNVGSFLEGNKCSLCTFPCKTCGNSSTKCLSCITNYNFDNSKYQCNSVCDSTCKTCSIPNDANSCTSCNDGSFLDGNKCSLCISPCKTCENSSTKCFSCQANYNFDNPKNLCNPVCDSTCKTCSKPKDANSCLDCNDGFFLEINKCSLCALPCKSCETSSTVCSSCVANYNFDSSKNQCNPVCDSTCKTCSKPNDANSCLSCNDGSFLDGSKCTLCSSPCKSCDTSSIKCLSCVANFLLDTIKNLCIPDCDLTCKTCSKPNDANSCISCHDGYFIDNNKCNSCNSPCKTCIGEAKKCLSCITNYTYDSTSHVCNPQCDNSCKTCQNPFDQNSCLSCNDGFYLDGNKCLKCQTPCSTCESNSQKCLSCISNYTFNSQQFICSPICDVSCKNCVAPLDPTKCQECQKEFYLSSGQCFKCSSPCKECIDSHSKCTSCQISYDYDSLKNTCTPICDSSCKTCLKPKDSTQCTSCQDGSFLSNGKCLACQFPCQTCENQQNRCLSCQINYTFDYATNSCKPNCDKSCKTCQNPNDSNSCLTCFDGYFLSGIQCIKCSSPCKTCVDNSNKCLSCVSDSDYTYVSKSKKCEPICDYSCLTCSEPKNPFKCISCADGTFLNQNQCQKCQAPCLTCKNSSTECLSCIDSKYTYDNQQNICKSICHNRCKTCANPDDSNSCTSCYDGFFLNGSQCQQCQSPCQNCQISANTCLSCLSGYSLKLPNICEIVCANQCKTCLKPLDNKQCSSCIDGFYLSNLQCLPCQNPCQNCINNANKCLSCNSSNYKFQASSNTCQMICDATCKTCNEPNNPLKCLDCPDGSYFIKGECKKCSQPCGNCQTYPTNCLSCISSNYILNSAINTCEPICDNSCKACLSPKDASKCISCQDGFYLDKGYCQKCLPPCSKCIDNNQKCTQCVDKVNYQFDAPSNKCIKLCHSSCNECSAPNDISKCISCNDGFYLDSGYCIQCNSPCNTCKNSTQCLTCLYGYILEPTSGQCQIQCDISCLSCNKSNDPNSCLSCRDGLFLNNLSQCQPCKSPCQNCNSSANKCTSCVTNYKLDSSFQSCSPICDSSCLTCSEPKNQSKCLSCSNGFFLTQNKCQKCQQPCKTCQDSADKCLSCISSDFIYDKSNFKCTSNCHSSCKACNGPSQSNCTDCFDNFYLDKNQCYACQSPCDNCTLFNDNCLSCINGYTLNGNKCVINCDQSCLTCSIPNDAKQCNSCKDGFYLDQGQCKSCQSPCSKCSNFAAQCTECIANYQLENNQCKPACDKSCKSCKKPADSNQCLNCFDGYYLNNSQCLQCSSPCSTCELNSTKCLTCQKGYQISLKNNNICELSCDSSCLTCSQNQNPKACLSCLPNKILREGVCLDCPQGEYLSFNQCSKCINNCKVCKDSNTCEICEDGYFLDSKKTCKQSSTNQNCHYTCNTCTGSSYSHCTQCAGNRVLNNKSNLTKQSQVVGTCECPSGTSDFNQPFCDSSKIQESIKKIATAFFISSGATTTVLAIISANPLVLGSLIEFSQTISFLTYINEKPALGFDSVAQNLYISHITKIFSFSGIKKTQSSRNLENTTQQNQLNSDGFTNNSKIILNDKYPEFVVNALSILIITGLAWLLSALTSQINILDPNLFAAKVKKIFCISFALCIFVLTSQEFSLLILFQFQQLGLENQIDTASALLTFIIFFYMIGFLGYLFFKLNYQQVLTKPMLIAQFAIKNSTKIHPIVNLSQTQDENKIVNPDYYTFYIVYQYIKQNSFLNRAFVQIVVIRKIATSLIMTFGYENPITQISVLLSLYFFYWLYVILSRPFKEMKHMIVQSVVETITLSMYILYLILLSNDSDHEKQKILSLVMLIFILIALLLYFLVSFVYLVLFAIKCLKKCGQKNNEIQVVNKSNHFEKDLSKVQLNQVTIQESKIYTRPMDTNYQYRNTNQNQITNYIQEEKLNSSLNNNQSIIQENLNLSKQIVSERIFLYSPERNKLQKSKKQKSQFENSNTINHLKLDRQALTLR